MSIKKLFNKKVLWIYEIQNVYRYLFKTPKTCKEITFYSEREGYYPFFEGIINELKVTYKRPCTYITSDPNDFMLKRNDHLIKVFYFNSFLQFFFHFANCKIMVMTVVGLNQSKIFKRSIFPVHYMYVFHSLVSTHMAFYFGAFDHYDSLICPGSRHELEIRKHEKLNALPTKVLVRAGDYRLERTYRGYQNYSKKRLIINKKKVILIAPSWGDQNIIESCGVQLVKILIESNYQVIIRPHSEIKKRRPDLIRNLEESFKNTGHFSIEMTGHNENVLFQSDLLISDYSGVALSFAFATERPVLFIDVPPKIKNPNYTAIGLEPLELSLRSKLGIVVPLNKLDKIPETALKLIKESPSYKQKIVDLRDKYIYAFGNSAQQSTKHLINICQQH